MIVYNLCGFLTSRWITVSDKNKNVLFKLAQATSKMSLNSHVDFHDDVFGLFGNFTI